ncbi:arabinosaccharide transport system permease protein [Paenibacillus endophyticus]|uniref:Arabinosaccharide transport system permease protein n=1 Tax=Paenibacillus endophyticus TaxID=1294268 RepID=A0A7W5CC63_9BACL|nr:sugar ABC transporter permease [Paenibacillus endophyticus]MBB3154114.1 arabinosaccharide transport system permease protein [Paenibacillus endophyticus]
MNAGKQVPNGQRGGGTVKTRTLNGQKLAPYLFILPFILSFLIFFSYPLVNAVLMSFQRVLPGDVAFIGLDNYKRLLNPDFYKALLNSTRYTFWTLLVLIPLPLLLAVFLNAKLMRARNFFRASLFIPALTSIVVAGIIFRLIFSELDGAIMNSFISWFGFDSQKWLLSPSLSMLALVVLATWRWAGINILYFLSALQSIPRELYESADIDGAGTIGKFWKITIPLLRPITIYVFTITIYGGYAMFTESFMLWGSRGSPQNIGLTMVGYIYQQGFQYFDLGFGSTIGITLLGITLLVSMLQLNVLGFFKKED